MPKFYTRYGSEITLLGWSEADWLGDNEWVNVQYSDGEQRSYHISDLRADNGLPEIIEYLNAIETPDTPMKDTLHPFDAYSKWNFSVALQDAGVRQVSRHVLEHAFSRSARLEIRDKFGNPYQFEAKVRAAEMYLRADIVDAYNELTRESK